MPLLGLLITIAIAAVLLTNNGSEVTEFYLYGEGNRVVSEAENIGPGLNRRMVVEGATVGS